MARYPVVARIGLPAAAALLLAVAAAYLVLPALRPAPVPPGLLYGNGHVEGREVRVSAEVAARVVAVAMEEGRAVARDDLLARLDDAELVTRLKKARADRRVLSLEQDRVAAQLETAHHHLKSAGADLARFGELRRSGTITPQQLRQAEDAVAEARSRVQVLQTRQAQLEAELEAARQQIALLELQLAKTRITAPIAGTVLVQGVEVGELAVPGQVVAVLVDLSRLELTVYIPERDIGKIKLGDPARLRVDAFPERFFDATVARVDQRAQFTPRDIHMPEERVRLVFGVTLAVANPEGWLKPGMPADAWIRWDPEQPWPPRLVVPQ